VKARLLTLAVALLLIAGCAKWGPPLEQRTTHGPTARQFWMLQMIQANGREPRMDERRHWEDQMDLRIAQYLHTHPEQANALHVVAFRFEKQVVTGMDKEQVLILLGRPVGVVTDGPEMEKLGRKYWRLIQTGNVTEAWVFELGWRFFFAGNTLVDITQYLERD
jgi:hypothetical protein